MTKKSKLKVQSSKVHKANKVHRALPSVMSLTKTAWKLLQENRRLFIGITIVYGLLTLLLVGLASNTNINNLKTQIDQSFHGRLSSGLAVFVSLLGSAGNSSSNTAGDYQFFLGLIASLAIIWALRQVIAEVSIRIRDAYYRGMYPLVPFVLVLLVIGLQLVPLLIGAFIYAQVMTNGIAVMMVEKLVWATVFGLLTLLSIYWVSSSIFALYIVSLPDMTPIKALRSASKLVKHRRWVLIRKLLFLPLMLLIVSAVIMLPFIIWITPLVIWVFFALSMSSLVVIHTYLYTLYRELINE